VQTSRVGRIAACAVRISLAAAGCSSSGTGGSSSSGASTPSSTASSDTGSGSSSSQAPDTSSSGGGDQTTTDGITDTTILFGNSSPQSGVFASAGQADRSLKACFDDLNATKGGAAMADGKTRKLELKIYDDAYDPAKTLENVKKLVEQDHVFAVTGVVGTPTNTSIAPYLNDQKVPQLFALSGASKFGASQATWPWTIGWSPSYATEAAIYAKWLSDTKKNATVAILAQNDGYGNDYLNSFTKSIEGTGISVVAKATYEPTDPTVDSQVLQLSRSNADVFFVITLPKQAAQALKKLQTLNWKPLRILANPAASVPSTIDPVGRDYSKGIISTNYQKDPSDPKWADDPAMQEYLQKIKKAENVTPQEPTAVQGFAYCQAIVETLKNAQPTRQGLMDAARNLSKVRIDLLLSGIVMNTSQTDPFPIESTYITEFDGTRFAPQGDAWDLEGKTPISTS